MEVQDTESPSENFLSQGNFDQLSFANAPEYLRISTDEAPQSDDWQTVNSLVVEDLLFRVNQAFPTENLTSEQRDIIEELLTYVPLRLRAPDAPTTELKEKPQGQEEGGYDDNDLNEYTTFLGNSTKNLWDSLWSYCQKYKDLRVEWKKRSPTAKNLSRQSLHKLLQHQSSMILSWMSGHAGVLLKLLENQRDQLSFSFRQIQLAFGRESFEAMPIRHLDRMLKREMVNVHDALQHCISTLSHQRRATITFNSIFNIPVEFEDRHPELQLTRQTIFPRERLGDYPGLSLVEEYRLFALQMRLVLTDPNIAWRGELHKVGHVIRSLRGKSLELVQDKFLKTLLETEHPENARWKSIFDILSAKYDNPGEDRAQTWLEACAEPSEMENLPQFEGDGEI